MAAEVVPVKPGEGDERDLDHLHQRGWDARKKCGQLLSSAWGGGGKYSG